MTPAPGTHGRSGRTLAAAALTLADFSHEIELALAEHGAGESSLSTPSLRIGGLLDGWGGLIGSTFILHAYSYVPGVTVSGRISAGEGTLRIGGTAAAQGTLHFNVHGSLSGVLSGQKVHLSPPATDAANAASPTAALLESSTDLLRDARRLAAARSGL